MALARLLVGNDLVDLTDPESRPERLHPRFNQRVFNTQERGQIDTSAEPHRTRWMLWAAKESTYKTAYKLNSATRFIPSHFSVDMDDRGTGSVRHAEKVFSLVVTHSKRWVHAITIYCADGAQPSSHVCRVEEYARGKFRVWLNGTEKAYVYAAVKPIANDSEGSASIESRKFVSETMAKVLALDAKKLEVVKTGKVPRLVLDQRGLIGDLSLSHHGGFVSFSCSAESPARPF